MGEAEKTEKITINLGLVDLGQIDLLVQEGFYSNRTDFIRTAIRNQLANHAEVVKRTVARRSVISRRSPASLAILAAVISARVVSSMTPRKSANSRGVASSPGGSMGVGRYTRSTLPPGRRRYSAISISLACSSWARW